MSLYNKYRPTSFDEFIGNEVVIENLKNILRKEEKPHAFLLYGPTGCGKTTLGRIIAKELGCVGSDYVEVDSAYFRGIDTIREIRKQSYYAPIEGSCRVWLIDECHQLGKDAMSALLKALEDTPKHVYYILCTTDPEKLLPTIKGRCSQFPVSLLNEKQVFKLLKKVVVKEGETLQKEVYDQIIQDSMGHARVALQILEQVLSAPVENRLEIAKRAAEKQSQVIELCRALLQGDNWKKVSNILVGLQEEEPEIIRRAVLGYCKTILLREVNNRAAYIMEQFLEPFYDTGFPGLVYACYSVVIDN